MKLFDITGEDIASLDDASLRVLIAELCRAELRLHGLPVSSVTAGGDQNAPDGGLDVRIELERGNSGFIPRSHTGFQVKVPDMPASEILKEMRPKDSLRPVIKELLERHGAYIIVSAKGSTADTALRARRAAMRDAVKDIDDNQRLFVDFYDRDRLASWVRLYPGIVSWLREQLGRPLHGWKAFGNWSAPAESPESEYIQDSNCCLHDDRSHDQKGLTIEEGINRIREVLRSNNGVARLIGLSGLGKTRLAQALFDDRVGINALNPNYALYTDLGNEPTPAPSDLINHLNRSSERSIVIVDNCLPSTHRTLAALCATPRSTVSLFTIEFDVGEDVPEGTEVFRLEPASYEVISQFIARREPQISQVNIDRIAEFSGGNYRIALAIARTVGRNDSISDLTDRDLFERLFHQGRQEDHILLHVAQICALAYSFDGETTSEPLAEMQVLASLAEVSIADLYRHIGELKSRGLLQQRGKWRAILPHAFANKLADDCLDHSIPDLISDTFQHKAPSRLLKSFSRRLGYLHRNETAQKIVKSWLDDDGFLSDLATLDDSRKDIFFNVSPVLPKLTLSTIKRNLEGNCSGLYSDMPNTFRYNIARLLRSIAYEREHFSEATKLLVKFLNSEPLENNYNSTRDMFKNLFHIYLSGTQATATDRLEFIDELRQGDNANQILGLMALNEMLESWHFSSSYGFQFGARPRDYGWQPESASDVLAWFNLTIDYASNLAIQCPSLAEQIKSILASKFRGLWIKAGAYDALERAAKGIVSKMSWDEGWISARRTLALDSETMPPEAKTRLMVVSELLRPKDLLAEARAYVFSRPWSALDIADGETDDSSGDPLSKHKKAEIHTESLGREVATSPELFGQLAQELVSKDSSGRQFIFGKGLAQGVADEASLRVIFETLISNYRLLPSKERNLLVVRGILSQTITTYPDFTNELLDQAISDTDLGQSFPELQCAIEIDARGARRLIASAKLKLAPAWQFGYLRCGRATDPISSELLCNLLDAIAAMPGGHSVCIEILHMNFYTKKIGGHQIEPELVEYAKSLLLKHKFDGGSKHLDHALATITNLCLKKDNHSEFAQAFCISIVEAINAHLVYLNDIGALTKTLFRKTPIIALSTLFSETIGNQRHYDLDEVFSLRDIPQDVLYNWAEDNPYDRYLMLARVVRIFEENDGNTLISSRALFLLEAAPDKDAILSVYENRLRPYSWSGSLLDTIERRRAALQILASHHNDHISNWAKKNDAMLSALALKERSKERNRDESFE